MKKIMLIFSSFLIMFTISGCNFNFGDKTSNENFYDEEILWVCDKYGEEYYYLFFQNGTVVDMDIVEYYKSSEFIENQIIDGKGSDIWTYVGTRNDLRLVRSYYTEADQYDVGKEIKYSKFYRHLLGRSKLFRIFCVETSKNEFYGKELGSVMFELGCSNEFVCAEVITYDWNATYE